MKAIMEENVLKIYFAGALFNSKDLIGNKILAETIERLAPRYKIVLPQDLEQGRASPKSIRDSDLKICSNATWAFSITTEASLIQALS